MILAATVNLFLMQGFASVYISSLRHGFNFMYITW